MNVKVIKHINKDEKNRVEFLLANYDYYDGNDLIAQLFLQDYHMIADEKIDGIHYSIISTSTLALQKAITEEYIPRISDILLENGIISVPLTYIVRKGKSHYICDSRLKTYLLSIMHNNKFEDEKLIEKLAELHKGSAPIDLDVIPCSDYVKKRICVEECQYHCEFAESCKYRKFRQQAMQRRYDFQVTNHNMVLADILNRKDGKDSLLPDRSVIIYDEAHKLIDAAKQMYELSLTKTEISRLLSNIHIILNACSNKRTGSCWKRTPLRRKKRPDGKACPPTLMCATSPIRKWTGACISGKTAA